MACGRPARVMGKTLVAAVLPGIPITPTSCPAHHTANLHPLLCSWTSKGLGPKGSRSVQAAAIDESHGIHSVASLS